MQGLVICSSATQIPLREGGSHPTGNFLGELVEPVEALLNIPGLKLSFATPRGAPVSIDKHSYDLMYWGFSKKNLESGKRVFDELLALGLKSPQALSTFASDDVLKDYDFVFVPGGHGPMVDILHEDFCESPALNAAT